MEQLSAANGDSLAVYMSRSAAPARRRRRSWKRAVVLGAVGALGLAAGWLVLTGTMARAELEQVRAAAERARAQVAAGDLAAARISADQLAANASRAHALTSGPVWALAGRIPYAGEPVRSVRTIAAVADRVGADAVGRLLTASDQLDPGKIRRADGTVEVDRITAAVPALTQASATVEAALVDVEALPAKTWLPQVDAARAEIVTELGKVAGGLRTGETAARLLPPMLGQDGPKTYFLAFQNNAEARGTGGLPGAYAILRAEDGGLEFRRFGTDDEFVGVKADVDLGDDFGQAYGDAPTDLFVNGNLSPHFPYAAQIWASMWQQKTGHAVDGVLAVDPKVLSYLLGVSGPAVLADGSSVTAANVVDLTQRLAYARFSDDVAARKRYLLAVAQASSAKVMADGVHPAKLVTALGKAAGERRLLVWSADPALQRHLAPTPLAGAVPETAAPYVGLSIYNEAGNKLDYYLDRSLTWTRRGCGPVRNVTVTVQLTNNAPAELSAYVTNRSDTRAKPTEPGDNRLMVNYLATPGALMRSVTVDGEPATAGSAAERGHPMFTVDVEIPRASTRTVVLHLTEPAAAGEPAVLRQPLVEPLAVQIDDEPCTRVGNDHAASGRQWPA